MRTVCATILALASTLSISMADETTSKIVPKGAKIFIAAMNGYEKYLTAAIEKKKVPVEVVTDRSAADFEITGASESKKAGAAKIILMGSWHSREQASITVTNLKSGEAVWAYAVNKSDSAHGQKSTAEACAKHFKEKIESGK